MRRLTLLAVLALGLAACGGSGGSKSTVMIKFGSSGGTMAPYAVTYSASGAVITSGRSGISVQPLSSAEDQRLSSLVQNGIDKLKSESCPGTFPDESALFITALGKTITVRGSCEPGFTKLWNALAKSRGLST